MIVFTTFKMLSLVLCTSDSLRDPGESYFSGLIAGDILAKCLFSIVLQVVLIRRRFELTAVVQCLVSYSASCSPSLPSSRRMALVLAWFLVTSLGLFVFGFAAGDPFTESLWKSFMYIVTDVLPTLHTALIELAIVAVHTACVFLGQDIADNVRGQVCSLTMRDRRQGSLSFQEDMETALQLRTLRMRQQVLHDIVRASNRAHAAASLYCLFITVMEGSICSFVGIADFRLEFLVWGVVLVMKFVSSCILGQQLCEIHSRISDTLQGFLVSYSSIADGTRREVQGFRHQVEMQDCRCGVYDLLYFDFPTLKAVIGTYMTCLVILSQFNYEEI
ncbi:uncharacterized protein LOC117650284 [Thrips palmi]|uniref:Gustatory receptor n=1 Tax=Thrips palmi TaxID=161013 RepID=A0A6P8ZWI6_THRPL|nr:uncharacterized protein LOC117650284 [Thrips palmi]